MTRRNRNRRSAVSDFFAGFNEGYNTINQVAQDIQMQRAATAEPEFAGATLDQAQPSTEPAKSVQMNGQEARQVGPEQATPDSAKTGLGVNQGVKLSKIEPIRMEATMQALPEVAKVQQRYQIAGRDVNPNDAASVDRGRTLAMADVMARYDPAQAMRMRSDLTRQEHDAWRMGREKVTAQRQDDEFAKAKDYEAGRNSLFGNTIFGRQQAAYAQQLQDWAKSGRQGPQPARPSYSLADRLADQAELLAYDARHNKLDAKGFMQFGEAMQKMQEEGYEKALRLAQEGGSLQDVAQAFNASGANRFNPADVVSDQVVKNRDGVQTRVITLKDGSRIDTLATLGSIGKATDIYNRAFATRKDERDERKTNAEIDDAKQRRAISWAALSMKEAAGAQGTEGGGPEPFDAKLATELAKAAAQDENKRRIEAQQPIMSAGEEARFVSERIGAHRQIHSDALVMQASVNSLKGLDAKSPEYVQTYARAMAAAGGRSKQFQDALAAQGFKPPPGMAPAEADPGAPDKKAATSAPPSPSVAMREIAARKQAEADAKAKQEEAKKAELGRQMDAANALSVAQIEAMDPDEAYRLLNSQAGAQLPPEVRMAIKGRAMQGQLYRSAHNPRLR